MRRLALNLLLAGAFVAGGCARKEPTAPPASPALSSPATSEVDEGDQAETPRREPGVARTLGVMTVDEVTAANLLPPPAGAAVLRPVGRAQVGERIEALYCFTGSPADAATSLVALYADAGWFQVTSKAHPTVPERYSLGAERPPYSLLGIVSRTQEPRCAADQGKTLVSVGVHKLQQLRKDAGTAVAPPAQVGPAGTTGRRPLRVP